MSTIAPMPPNELGRIIDLSEYNLDYTSLENHFKDLARLAASVTGSYISLVNLIDSYTQWTVATNGIPFDTMQREESVCQWTINESEKFEVKDLSADERFNNRDLIIGNVPMKYYYGVPLTTPEGHSIGALCVLSNETLAISPEKEEMLKIIGNEIINRLRTIRTIEVLKNNMREVAESKKRVAHDIRGPLAGIIGLAGIISDQGTENQLDEVLEFVSLIHKSGSSLLELANEILSVDLPKAGMVELGQNQFNQIMLKEKLEKLYASQAKNKQINFEVSTTAQTEAVPFSKNKLLQIVGNLISNSIKFTPAHGTVSVNLSLKIGSSQNTLHITVSDTGVGLSAEQQQQILNGVSTSSEGTGGEQGYGFGLTLVKHLVESLKGKLSVHSEINKGTTFTVELPQSRI